MKRPDMPADSNPYESPSAATPLATQVFPWVAALRFLGGFLIATSVFASLFWTVWARELPGHFPDITFFAYLVGSWALVAGLRPGVRIGLSGLACALCQGFTIALIVLFIPPPRGGVNMFWGIEGAILGGLFSGIFAGVVGLVLTAVGELLLYSAKWLLRRR